MIRRVSQPFILALLFSISLCPAMAHAESEPVQVQLLAGEEYVGTIDHKKTRYLKVTLQNLTAEPATCLIAFYRERIELSTDRMGPVEFRTFTLENEGDHQTRVWTTLNFDEFTLNVTAGQLQVTIEKPMQLR
jgi:hypothetical protein